MSITVSTEWLFFHLWKKHSEPHGVLIPDTVIYRWTQPMFQYSTSAEGHIVRRTKEHINLAELEERLTQAPSDIVSLTIYTNAKKEPSTRLFETAKPKVEETNVFEFQTTDTFRAALHNKGHRLTMIFQQFVYPRDSHLSTIRVDWSPFFSFVSKRTALKPVLNQKLSVHERIATFESWYCLTKEELTSHLLSSDLQRLCDNIASHIANVSVNNITVKKMVLYFRVDTRDNIQLLFASEIKLSSRHDLSLETIGNTENRLTLRKILFRDPSKAVVEETTGLKDDNRSYCRNCERLTFDLYPLQFRHILQATELGFVGKAETLMSPEFLKMRREVAKRKEERIKTEHRPRRDFSTPEEEVKFICDEL
jgi:hypothetical protein